MLKKSIICFILTLSLVPLAAQDSPSVLTDRDVEKFVETYPAIEAELEKKSEEYGEDDPLQDKEDISSMMAALYNYGWVREVFQSHGWDEMFMTVKFPAIISGIMMVSFEKGLDEMSEKERAAWKASGMMDSFTAAFGQVNPKDKDIIVRHFDDLVGIFDVGD